MTEPPQAIKTFVHVSNYVQPIVWAVLVLAWILTGALS